jgi:hypothetical protein
MRMPKYALKIVGDRLVIDLGVDEEDVQYSYGYDGTPKMIDTCDIWSAEVIGTVELTEEQLSRIRVEYQNGGKCDYCDELVRELRTSPFLADAGARMCQNCWNMTRETYIGSEGTDIGPFEGAE